MGSSKKSVNIQITEKALAFIKTRRLNNPLVLVNLGYRSGGDDSCSGGSGGKGGGGCGGGGGGCGESESTACTPYMNVVMADGQNPGGDFVKVDTEAGIPVYLAKGVFDTASKTGTPLTVTLKGLVMKRLSVEGIDPASLPLPKPDSQKGAHHH